MAQHADNHTPSDLMIYNTLTRSLEPFSTIEPGKVRMYVCGVTVYDHAHIGHVMSSIVFDMIRRYLMYLGYDVTFAQNFTDVDDKIINRANAEGINPTELTERMIAAWGSEMSPFNVLPATMNPRATQAIPQIVEMIGSLIEKGHAYEANGDVYFKVRSFPEYGKLSHRDIDDLLAGARIATGDQKADPLDFALWKAAKPGEPTWESPWSNGRPGWHIECSAMNADLFGDQIDIHGGGRDLIFPHHENEVAQTEAFTGHPPFARFWMHNGMLQLADEKMSKSIGNVVRPTEIIERALAMAFRLQVLSSHYRAPLTFSREGLEAAQNGLDRLRAAARPIHGEIESRRDNELDMLVDQTVETFHRAMLDDFDTPVAVAAIFDLARAINRERSAPEVSESVADARTMLVDLAGILGLDLGEVAHDQMIAAEPFIDLLIQLRNDLRSAKQFAIADQVRDELAELGVTLEDTKQGTTWKTS